MSVIACLGGGEVPALSRTQHEYLTGVALRFVMHVILIVKNDA